MSETLKGAGEARLSIRGTKGVDPAQVELNRHDRKGETLGEATKKQKKGKQLVIIRVTYHQVNENGKFAQTKDHRFFSRGNKPSV